MREALLAELGAVAVYRALAARTRDSELAEVLARFQEEEELQVRRLSEVMTALGARPRRRSLRRLVAACLLVSTTRLFGPRFALRVCEEAEGAISRSYRELAFHLAQSGRIEQARICDDLSLTKARHAQILSAWVENLPARR